MGNEKNQDRSRNYSENGEQGNDTVDVLYQRLGERWYAFSLIEDEVFVGSVSDEILNDVDSKPTKVHKISGNS